MDIIEGDNAAEITGEQREPLASKHMSETSRPWAETRRPRELEMPFSRNSCDLIYPIETHDQQLSVKKERSGKCQGHMMGMRKKKESVLHSQSYYDSGIQTKGKISSKRKALL